MGLTTKYTNDGKKVVVIGNLNSQEKIVQEVFLVNGTEVPSGENFVVKSLHDHPVVSWKEAHLKKINEEYDRTYDVKIKELEQLKRKFSLQSDTVKAKLQAICKLESSISEDSFDLLLDFISGRIEYLVIEKYGDLDIRHFDEELADKDDYGRFDELKLCSVFGRSNGDLQYKINRYSDGSGHSTVVFPCRNYDEAIAKLTSLYNERMQNGLTDNLIKAAKKYNLHIPKEAMDRYNEERSKSLLETIEAANKRIEELREELKRLSNE